MKVFFIDSFTNEKFKGNPAAVCLMEGVLSVEVMQQVATEIGFSETAFVSQKSEGSFAIRFFTPIQEIALCGHATLASAMVVFKRTSLQKLQFENKDGIVLSVEKAGSKIKMQFPSYDVTPVEVPEALVQALGIKAPVKSFFNKELNIILVEMGSAENLQQLRPDSKALRASYQGIAGVLVTAKSNHPPRDFEYRYFWPWIGTDEDPVTGAVQTFLTPYWAKRLNKKYLSVFQSSPRTGHMETELNGNVIYIFGEGVEILEGNINI